MDQRKVPPERPWLLPYNRRLRHLQGIALRNLASTASTSTASTSHLTASHSSTASHTASTASTARPTTRLRRRSTLEWTNASPLTRQKRLEDMTAGRLADTFFSLHLPAITDPVYVSEVAEKAMNPSFRFFDLAPCGPPVTRLDVLTVRVWAKSDSMQRWQLLVDCTVHLASLHFVGKTLASYTHPLPQNCLLFHMTDGIYTASVLPAPQLLAPPKESPDGRPATSSSYDALMRLSTLDDCIQDALLTRDRIADDIERILETSRPAMSTVEQLPEAEETLRTVQAAVTAEHRRVLALRRRRDDLAASLQSRRDKMRAGREKSALVASELPTRRELCNETSDAIQATAHAIAAQRRRLCEDLLNIYPIDPVPAKPLAFTIRGLPLPNSSFDAADPPTTAAALGHTAQLLSTLSPYLGLLLPYPPHPCGSTSTVADPLALAAHSPQPRTYPLFPRAAPRYRFEYAVFLLNKDVEILSNALGVRPLDIRHTLPNLKYALYVATAGTGGLPARSPGGIQALDTDMKSGKAMGKNGDGSGMELKSGKGIQGSRLRMVL